MPQHLPQSKLLHRLYLHSKSTCKTYQVTSTRDVTRNLRRHQGSEDNISHNRYPEPKRTRRLKGESMWSFCAGLDHCCSSFGTEYAKDEMHIYRVVVGTHSALKGVAADGVQLMLLQRIDATDVCILPQPVSWYRWSG